MTTSREPPYSLHDLYIHGTTWDDILDLMRKHEIPTEWDNEDGKRRCITLMGAFDALTNAGLTIPFEEELTNKTCPVCKQNGWDK